MVSKASIVSMWKLLGGFNPEDGSGRTGLSDLRDLVIDLAFFDITGQDKISSEEMLALSFVYDRIRAIECSFSNEMPHIDKDLDAHGRKFLENEELMLSILRFRMNAANIVSHTSGFPNNLTVPVARGRRPYASGRFRIRPTKALFKKYYAGRPKSQGGDMPDKRR